MDFLSLNGEEQRKQNIADNKRILAEIGLISSSKALPKFRLKTGLKRKAETEIPRKTKHPLIEENVDHVNFGLIQGSRRRSARLHGNNAHYEDSSHASVDEDDENSFKRVEKNRPNFYGAIPGVDVGASWYTRMECCRDCVHRPTVAGIHRGPEGAYSIALSGGYDDNVDYGESFTYTGEGGRDLKGTKANPKNRRMAPQSKDQTLTRGNLALKNNIDTGKPVRVIRGYKLQNPFAPEVGYRYDGLYTVEKAWYAVGISGFMVWKFALRRCQDQAPPPWEFTEDEDSKSMNGREENHVENLSSDIKERASPEPSDIDDGDKDKTEQQENRPDKANSKRNKSRQVKKVFVDEINKN